MTEREVFDMFVAHCVAAELTAPDITTARAIQFGFDDAAAIMEERKNWNNDGTRVVNKPFDVMPNDIF